MISTFSGSKKIVGSLNSNLPIITSTFNGVSLGDYFWFYQITTVSNNNVIELLIHPHVFGHFEYTSERQTESNGQYDIFNLYMFIPDHYLSDLQLGMKVVTMR